jgi:flagellar FliJ protein
MKRFHFRLEPLLELRINTEKEWERKLAEVNGEINSANRKIRESQAEIRRSLNQDAGDLAGLQMRDNYIARMNQTIQKSEVRKLEARGRLELVQKGYMKAARERKMIETLKDKHQIRFQKEQQKIEQAEMDEIGTINAARQRQERAQI